MEATNQSAIALWKLLDVVLIFFWNFRSVTIHGNFRCFGDFRDIFFLEGTKLGDDLKRTYLNNMSFLQKMALILSSPCDSLDFLQIDRALYTLAPIKFLFHFDGPKNSNIHNLQ